MARDAEWLDERGRAAAAEADAREAKEAEAAQAMAAKAREELCEKRETFLREGAKAHAATLAQVAGDSPSDAII